MPVSNSRDVYRKLVENDEETSWLYGLVSFAVFEERRIEWMNHFEETKGTPPTETDIEDWYKQQPDGAILRAKGEAETALQLYAQDLEENILETERSEIEKGIIVREIRHLRRPWADFGINIAAGFFSALLFAIAITIFVIVALADASPVEIGKWLGEEENRMIENGKENNKSGSN